MNTPKANSTWVRKRGPSVGRWPFLLLLLIMTTGSGASAQSDLGRIIFVSVRDGKDSLFVMDADGGNQTRLTSGAADGYPSWSPDGCKIAFKRLDDIYMMDADGSDQILVWDDPPGFNPEGDHRLYFSPEGSRILFGPGLNINNVGSGGIDTLAGSSGSWSPDGSKILFECGSGKICIMNPDGTARHEVANGYRPAWSPDGSKIAFVANGIEVINLDGTNAMRLVADTAYVPSWSPDGSKIAFETGPGGIFLEVINADGTNRIKLADQLMFDMYQVFPVSWSPDGSKIVFARKTLPLSETSPQTPGLDIYAVNADGSDLTRLTTGDKSLGPVWSPTVRCEE